MRVLHLVTSYNGVCPSSFWPRRFEEALADYEGIDSVRHTITDLPYPDVDPDVVIVYDIERHSSASASARRYYPSSRIIGLIPYPIMSSYGVAAVRDAYLSCDYLVGDIAELAATLRSASRLNIKHMDTPIRVTPRYFHFPDFDAEAHRPRAVITIATEDYHVPASFSRKIMKQGYQLLEITGDEDMALLGRMFRLVQFVVVPGFDQKTAQLGLEASACGAFVIFHDEHPFLCRAYPQGASGSRYYRKGYRSIHSWCDEILMKDFTVRAGERHRELLGLESVVAPFMTCRNLEDDPIFTRLLKGKANVYSIPSGPPS
jgi:hypothetical protein